MSLNFFIFFAYYFIILFSILGYGYFLLSFEKNNKNYLNFGYIGIIGLFSLTAYSYLSNIFISHSKNHNILVIILGLISFLYFFIKYYENKIFKKNLIFLILFFLILSIALFIKKNHDDFPYYHFAYTFNLTQNSLDFGIGKFNHGFRTPSSIFYLNSLFYLPLAEYYLFNFSAFFILGFSNIILLKKISNFFEDFKFKVMKIDHLNYLSLLCFVFINIFFYRLSEHGTDRSAQILVFILIIYLLETFKLKENNKIDLFFIAILFTLIISLKAFYFLYLLFVIPLFYFLSKKKNKVIPVIKLLLFKRYSFYSIFLIFLVILSYFVNTGCLLYPISFTCFESFAWSLPIESVNKMNDWYELWSKAGANPNYRVSNPEQYIIEFNWVSNWINSYFFNKVSDFIYGLLFTLLVFWFLFRNLKKKKIQEKFNIYILLTYSVLVLILFEWFFNHPALRYGGFCVIALIIFIPFALYLNRFQISHSKFNKIAIILVIIAVSVFEIRNIKRVINEVNIYNYKPFTETFYSIDKNYFILQKKMESLKNNNGFFSKTIF